MPCSHCSGGAMWAGLPHCTRTRPRAPPAAEGCPARAPPLLRKGGGLLVQAAGRRRAARAGPAARASRRRREPRPAARVAAGKQVRCLRWGGGSGGALPLAACAALHCIRCMQTINRTVGSCMLPAWIAGHDCWCHMTAGLSSAGPSGSTAAHAPGSPTHLRVEVTLLPGAKRGLWWSGSTGDLEEGGEEEEAGDSKWPNKVQCGERPAVWLHPMPAKPQGPTTGTPANPCCHLSAAHPAPPTAPCVCHRRSGSGAPSSARTPPWAGW